MNSIYPAKEQQETGRPTLLFSIILYGGYTLNVCDLDTGAGSANYNGTLYLSGVARHNLSQSSLGTMGIDTIASLSLDLMDANRYYFGYEWSTGFQGASITATWVFYDPRTDTFSPDSVTVFNGICDPATRKGNELLSITARSIYDLTKKLLPKFPIQYSCPKAFPTTYAQRSLAAWSDLSPYYDCGYSADQTIYGSAGNYNGGSVYTSCNKSKANCVARGMYSADNAGRTTLRFGGTQWLPPATWKGRSYTAGKTLQGVNSINEQKYSQYAPLTYGTTWVDGIFLNVCGDPNSTRGEVVCGNGSQQTSAGDLNTVGVQLVLVNGMLIPRYDQTSDLLNRWYPEGDGSRNGAITQGAIYSGLGDPNGSQLKILPTVYAAVAASSQAPSCRVLVGPRALHAWYANGSDASGARTDSLAWVMLDLLRLSRPDMYSIIDRQQVINYSLICAAYIPYTRIDGTTGSHIRFKASLTLPTLTQAATVIEGLKIAGKLMLVPNASGSAILFWPKLPLADQHPNPVTGSNDSTLYVGYHLTDTAGSPSGHGYSAYTFDDTNVIDNSVQILQDPIASQPTVFKASIQDEDNSWIADTVTFENTARIDRVNQRVTSTVNAIGLPNLDQALRCLATKAAETSYGNPANDPSRGTICIQFQTTFRGVHLHQGMLIRFSNTQLAISGQWFRIEKIGYSENLEILNISARWHSDLWYLDSFVG